MPRLPYTALLDRPLNADKVARIRVVNEILEEYEQQGYDLTVRQVYYQHVARGLIPNNDREYKRLAGLINEGRLAGLIDWDSIIDRTRYLRPVSSWRDPSAIMRGAAASYQRDLWDNQPVRFEVWVEKDALVGVVEVACRPLRVPYLSCRGYTSSSEMWRAAQRIYDDASGRDRKTIVVHLGDHDPSGIDMSRDIEDRILTFMATDWLRGQSVEGGDDDDAREAVAWAEEHFELRRVALNWDQVQQYGPPPNPAKLTDSRGRGYIEKFGRSSWELDALEPSVLAALIEHEVFAERDEDVWKEDSEQEDEERDLIKDASSRWRDVAAFLAEGSNDGVA